MGLVDVLQLLDWETIKDGAIEVIFQVVAGNNLLAKPRQGCSSASPSPSLPPPLSISLSLKNAKLNPQHEERGLVKREESQKDGCEINVALCYSLYKNCLKPVL